MTSLAEEIVGVLGATVDGVIELAPAVRVRAATVPVVAWGLPGPDSLAADCRKRGSLLRTTAGHMTCLEVEVVRTLRAHGLEAGWVQGFPCGRELWAAEIFAHPLPPALDAVNARVQGARGVKPGFSGHPDVAATDGIRVAYVECKVRDEPKPSQVTWISAALANAILDPDDVAVLRGVFQPR